MSIELTPLLRLVVRCLGVLVNRKVFLNHISVITIGKERAVRSFPIVIHCITIIINVRRGQCEDPA